MSVQPTTSRHGFTLIELVIAMSAASVISLVVGLLLMEGSRTLASSTGRSRLADSSARAMEQMLRYLREVAQDEGLTGQAQISTASTTDLRFSLYGFRLNGGNIEMTTDGGASWQTNCRNVSSLTFRYYAADGSELTATPLSASDRAAVRRISVELAVSALGESHRIRSGVYLRSFMSDAAS
jgi:prepilin-type N-terminal cleavage/methylation domain-containing protein